MHLLAMLVNFHISGIYGSLLSIHANILTRDKKVKESSKKA
jgi:hypothetical protein